MPISKKKFAGRVLWSKTVDNREHSFHATKGLRTNRIPQPRDNAATRLLDLFREGQTNVR